jgi:hypothetical protein
MSAPNSNYKYDNQPLQIRQSATINTTIMTRTILAADSNYIEDNESSGFFLSQTRAVPVTPGRQEKCSGSSSNGAHHLRWMISVIPFPESRACKNPWDDRAGLLPNCDANPSWIIYVCHGICEVCLIFHIKRAICSSLLVCVLRACLGVLLMLL